MNWLLRQFGFKVHRWVATHPSGFDRKCTICGEQQSMYELWVLRSILIWELRDCAGAPICIGTNPYYINTGISRTTIKKLALYRDKSHPYQYGRCNIHDRPGPFLIALTHGLPFLSLHPLINRGPFRPGEGPPIC